MSPPKQRTPSSPLSRRLCRHINAVPCERGALVPPKQSSRRRRPCVVTIGSGEHHRQRSTALIDEEVDLRPEYAPVGGIVAHFLASKGAGECFESIACHFQPI